MNKLAYQDYCLHPAPNFTPANNSQQHGKEPPCCFEHHDNNLRLMCCCYTCPKKPTNFLSCIGVCLLVFGYAVTGAFIFATLEGGQLLSPTSTSNPSIVVVSSSDVGVATSASRANREAEMRSQTVDKLWSITENLNILYRENWTKLATDEIVEFQRSLLAAQAQAQAPAPGRGALMDKSSNASNNRTSRWTFSSAFLYSLTLISTIGCGNVAPKTQWGKLATIAYAMIGIPLMLFYLSTAGDLLAHYFRRLYTALLCRPRRKAGKNDLLTNSYRCTCNSGRDRVPISLCVLIILVYICCGAFLFHRLENWSLLEGSYFCFISLGTIGFGNMIPGRKVEEVSVTVFSVYILTGMALVAMCFSLLQDKLSRLFRYIETACHAQNGGKGAELPPS